MRELSLMDEISQQYIFIINKLKSFLHEKLCLPLPPDQDFVDTTSWRENS